MSRLVLLINLCSTTHQNSAANVVHGEILKAKIDPINRDNTNNWNMRKQLARNETAKVDRTGSVYAISPGTRAAG